ncbi:CopG family transcriptional regulator [Plectonema cf. radiosum LEGE 06105]|uniref:CopG family transcriptional regulator n=1 Tax=Plectonema cf. radiosum LEGE 06105 TaxID=945769 RepID=A0A8J7F5V8_9CYAN|nr:CopG family transcriptional regulator [Plectonema radiosum]MBE9211939.1 CopG family transcriptional regulator [Plectonema cf. radiosum LEGE 06105]
MKKKQTPVYLDDFEKEKLKKIAQEWGISQSAAMKRLIREYNAG